jgi:hypothetical protein
MLARIISPFESSLWEQIDDPGGLTRIALLLRT